MKCGIGYLFRMLIRSFVFVELMGGQLSSGPEYFIWVLLFGTMSTTTPVCFSAKIQILVSEG